MCPLFSLCFSLFFDESMNHVMPVAVYLATKFWMYFTWFFYLMPCILWCWHHIGAINTGEHFQAELEILCVHLGVPGGCELCSTLLWSWANHNSHSFFFSSFFFASSNVILDVQELWKCEFLWELWQTDGNVKIDPDRRCKCNSAGPTRAKPKWPD